MPVAKFAGPIWDPTLLVPPPTLNKLPRQLMKQHVDVLAPNVECACVWFFRVPLRLRCPTAAALTSVHAVAKLMRHSATRAIRTWLGAVQRGATPYGCSTARHCTAELAQVVGVRDGVGVRCSRPARPCRVREVFNTLLLRGT